MSAARRRTSATDDRRQRQREPSKTAGTATSGQLTLWPVDSPAASNARSPRAARLLTQSNRRLKDIGVWTWTLPAWAGRLPDGRTYNTCPSAGICRQVCYALHGAYLWPVVRSRHQANLRLVLDFSGRDVREGASDLLLSLADMFAMTGAVRSSTAACRGCSHRVSAYEEQCRAAGGATCVWSCRVKLKVIPSVGTEVGDGFEVEAFENGDAARVAVRHAGEDVGGATPGAGEVD
jgi:Gene product 88